MNQKVDQMKEKKRNMTIDDDDDRKDQRYNNRCIE